MLKDISLSTKKFHNPKNNGSFILKNDNEISQLRESAYIVRDLLLQLHKIVKPGVNELDIASFCENYMLIRGAIPILKTENISPYAILISKNNIAFHGIPQDYILKDGDIITVDVVLVKDGWFGDGAWTYEIGHCEDDAKNLIKFSHEIIYSSVELLKETNDISSIAKNIQKKCEGTPYRVLEEGAGHGIGLNLHEDPQILFSEDAESIELQKGMVFTIEPVIVNSKEKLKYTKEGVAYIGEDFLCAQFEHMIAVNEDRIEILTDRNPLFK